MGKHGNEDDRRAKRSAALRLYARKVGRQAQKGVEPNDRTYDKKQHRRLRRMSAVEIDRLLRHGDDDVSD